MASSEITLNLSVDVPAKTVNFCMMALEMFLNANPQTELVVTKTATGYVKLNFRNSDPGK